MTGPIFQRSKHDKENPYAQLSRALLRDQSISFACRGLLAYLLSMADGWRINARQLIEHCKGHYGRDKVYSLINEAIGAGYIEREEYEENNLRRTVYNISEEPRFKKCFRRPEIQDAGNQDAEKPDDKERTSLKKDEEKERAKAHCSEQSETDRSRAPEISYSFETQRFENIETKDIESWKKLYPSLDIDHELRAMNEWIKCNPSKAKSKKLWRKFITLWLRKGNEDKINREATKYRGNSYETDRRPRDEFGNVKASQYAGVFQ